MAENDFAVVVPMANEEKDFHMFKDALSNSPDWLPSPGIPSSSFRNSLNTLLHFFRIRITVQAISIK